MQVHYVKHNMGAEKSHVKSKATQAPDTTNNGQKPGF